jgi:hypothetical protein
VDGVDNVQTYTGLPRATPSQEAVREFRILQSTYAAEYGRALGGFVNIVTTSGTNEPHGSVYYYGMDDGLASPSILNAPGADQLSQHQYGAFFGGPLQKDRTFVFASYEGQHRSESNQFSSVIRDNFAAINAARARYGLSLETLDQVRTNDYNTFMAKLDHNASDRFRLSLRYNFLDSEALNFPGGAGRASAASSAARDNHTRDHSAVLGATATFTPRLLGGALQWARRSYLRAHRGRADHGGDEPHPHGQDDVRPRLLQGRPPAGLGQPALRARRPSREVRRRPEPRERRGHLEPLLPGPHHLPERCRVHHPDSGRVLVSGPHRLSHLSRREHGLVGPGAGLVPRRHAVRP